MPECLQCNKTFDLKSHKAGRFCGLPCYHTYQKKHSYQPAKVCPNCGKTFVVEYGITRTAIARIRFCSLKCARQGVTVWNKGLTKETDIRVNKCARSCSEASKGRVPWNKGKKGIYADLTLQRISAGNKRRTEKRKHLKQLAFREDARQRTKALWQDASFRARQIAIFNTEKSKIKRSESAKKRARRLWQDPGYKREKIKVLAQSQHRKPNRPEQQLGRILEQYFTNNWKYTGDGFLSIGNYMPDFTNCNGKKQVIELFGDFWHGKGAEHWHQSELGRIMAYNSLGFDCLVIWEHELKDEQAVVAKVKHFMKG